MLSLWYVHKRFMSWGFFVGSDEGLMSRIQCTIRAPGLRNWVPPLGSRVSGLRSKSYFREFKREELKLQVLLFSSQCTLLLSKNALLFPEFQFHFSEVPFCFLELFFSIPEMPSFYLLCLSFSKNVFFQAECTFLFNLELLRDICLTLFFPLGTLLYLPTYDAFLIKLQPPQ